MMCGSNGAKDRTRFTACFVSFRLRNRIQNNPFACLHGSDTVLNVGGADHNAGIQIAMGSEVAHCTTVTAATAPFSRWSGSTT